MKYIIKSGNLFFNDVPLFSIKSTLAHSEKKIIDENGKIIMRRGLCGGWLIDAFDDFSPEILCGIFVFCRYVEQENEFLIV